LNNIKRKLTSQAVKIRADIEVACYGYEGIDAVKTALRAGLACSTEELPIKINLIAPPLYGNILWKILLIQPHNFGFRCTLEPHLIGFRCTLESHLIP
jgi:hypothetical protein